MIITQASLAALFKGYRAIYMSALQGAKPQYTGIAMRVPSVSESELYAWLGAVPGMRKLVGEIQIRNLSTSTYTITNDEFEDTVAVPQKSIERDTYGVYNPLMAAMGVAAAQHPDELVANLLINGFDNVCYTGKKFFDSNHAPTDKGGKFSNVGTKKLSAANYVIARTNIMSRLNSEGRPMNLGRDLVLYVAPQNEQLAKEILQADYVMQAAKNVAGTENVGGAAVSNINKNSARVVSLGYLATTPDAWFLVDEGQPIKPLIFQEEKPTEFMVLNNPTSDHVFKKKEYLYQSYGRYNAGYALPELAYGSDGSQPA